MNGGIVTLEMRKKRLNSHHYVIFVECYKTIGPRKVDKITIFRNKVVRNFVETTKWFITNQMILDLKS